MRRLSGLTFALLTAVTTGGCGVGVISADTQIVPEIVPGMEHGSFGKADSTSGAFRRAEFSLASRACRKRGECPWRKLGQWAQGDQRWARIRLFGGNQCDQYMKNAGSAITTHAVLSSYYHLVRTPRQQNRCLGMNEYHIGCTLVWDGCLPDGVDYAGPGSPELGEISAELKKGRPMIAAVRHSSKSECHHFVVVTGFDRGAASLSDFEIFDPASGSLRRLDYYAEVCGTRLFSSDKELAPGWDL